MPTKTPAKRVIYRQVFFVLSSFYFRTYTGFHDTKKIYYEWVEVDAPLTGYIYSESEPLNQLIARDLTTQVVPWTGDVSCVFVL